MKTVLVTGAYGGIGSAICSSLEGAGYAVARIGREDADLGLVPDIERLAERMRTQYGSIDWLVCAHGYLDAPASLEEESAEAIRTTFEVNALSLFYLAQRFLSLFPEGGGMVVIASSAGLKANGLVAAYSASKAAAISFVQGLARNRTDLNFYAVCPGPTNTAMRERFAHDAAGKQEPEVVARVVARLIDGDPDARSGDVLLVRDGTTSTEARID